MTEQTSPEHQRHEITTRHYGTRAVTMSDIRRRMQALTDELDDLESELNRLTLAGMNGAPPRRTT